jgi:hypothetical protein
MLFRYRIEPGPFQLVQTNVQRTGLSKLLLLLGFVFLRVGRVVVLMVIVAAVQIATVVSILIDPSVGEWFSILVVLYVISVALASLGISRVSGIGEVKMKPAINLPDQ